jgi:hypothetical protein
MFEEVKDDEMVPMDNGIDNHGVAGCLLGET